MVQFLDLKELDRIYRRLRVVLVSQTHHTLKRPYTIISRDKTNSVLLMEEHKFFHLHLADAYHTLIQCNLQEVQGGEVPCPRTQRHFSQSNKQLSD